MCRNSGIIWDSIVLGTMGGFRLHGVQTAYDRVFWSRGPSSFLPLLLPYGGIHIGCTGEGYGRGPANGLGNRI